MPCLDDCNQFEWGRICNWWRKMVITTKAQIHFPMTLIEMTQTTVSPPTLFAASNLIRMKVKSACSTHQSSLDEAPRNGLPQTTSTPVDDHDNSVAVGKLIVNRLFYDESLPKNWKKPFQTHYCGQMRTSFLLSAIQQSTDIYDVIVFNQCYLFHRSRLINCSTELFNNRICR